jgi:hypothetical protein
LLWTLKAKQLLGVLPVNKTDAISRFLSQHTISDLANLYSANMEVQVNVAQDSGSRIEGDYKGRQWHGWTDGIQTWKSFRIPYKAKSEPEYIDRPISFDLVEHAEGIGLTGWDWVNRYSKWVGFDFDALVGHAEAHAKKLTEEELENIKKVITNVPWVTLRKSTSGKGLHLYVFIDNFPTKNHTEHAAVARAILSKLSQEVGFDFNSKVDTCITKDTWTFTANGPRQVKDLIGKPTNLIVNGQSYKTEGFFRTSFKEVYELETIEGYKLKATGDHKILTSYSFGREDKRSGINIPCIMDQELLKLIPGDTIFLNNHQNISWSGEGSYNEGYILGWLYGDGYFSSKNTFHGLCFFPDDYCMIDYVTSLLPDYKINYSEKEQSYKIYSSLLEILRIKFGCDTAKEINEHIEIASSDFLRGFVSAFFDTDGDARESSTTIRLSQSNLERLEAVQRILLRFGIKSSISKDREACTMQILGRTVTTQDKHVLTIGRENVATFVKRIGFNNPRKKEIVEKRILTITEGVKSKLASESFLVRVKSITKIGFETVYCCTVPGLHHIDANGFFTHQCGGNMWFWHRKMKGTDGLTLLKEGTKIDSVPANWQEHLRVITGRKTRTLPKFIETQDNETQDLFTQLTSQRIRIQLDQDHKKLIYWMEENYPNSSWWDADHHMYVTHTFLISEAHRELAMKGVFKTVSQGREKGSDHNCFGGDTLVLTKQGPKKIRELAEIGRVDLLVKTPNGFKWINSEVKSFGTQITYPILFGDGSKYRTTYNHFWIDRKGNRFPTWLINSRKTELAIANQDLPEIDWEGYAHGFVFGDGWEKNTRGKESCEVALFKFDNDLTKLLCKYGQLGSQYYEGHGYINVIRQLPKYWKLLPNNKSKEYILGFILGLTCADGFVNTQIQIFQSDYNVIKWLQENAIYCGLKPYQIRYINRTSGYDNAKDAWALTISTYNVKAEMFLRRDFQLNFKQRKAHQCMTVLNIDWEQGQEEEVFCAVVPLYHNFTLANLVVTGNCFLHPIKKGAWAVRRYSPGVKESVTWEQDGSGWTKCYLNREADLDCAAKAFEGLEDPKGGFEFKTFEQAKQAALLLGVDLNVPNNYLMRKTKLKRHKSSRLCVEFQRETSDPGVNGWVAGTKIWSKLFDVKLFNGSAEPEFLYNDDGIRHIVSEGGDNRGWMIRVENDWHAEPLEHVKAILISGGFKPAEVPLILGHNVAQCWRMVNKPFEEEFLPNRQWNKNAARFRYKPTVEIDNLNYEPWLKVLNHCGESLNEAIKNNVWCQENAIITGGDYLKCWIASLFKYPTEPLPYLFLYGPQGSGKSIFHEALELLFVAGFGYMRADFALISPAGFNGELENSVLCVVEETDLRKNNVAYNRIKDWVTSRQIPIHRKQQQPYLVPNTTHWIQTANSHLYCPVFSGDTRITMIYVDDLKTEERIPKTELITKLEACASDFLAEILNLEVPKSNDRLRIPVLQTEDKAAAERGNQSMLEMFCEEKIYFYEGKRILFSEFYEKFIEWLDPNQIPEWSKVRVSKEMPLKIISGRCRSNNQKYIGNVSWQVKGESDPTLPKLVIRNGHLECA